MYNFHNYRLYYFWGDKVWTRKFNYMKKNRKIWINSIVLLKKWHPRIKTRHTIPEKKVFSRSIKRNSFNTNILALFQNNRIFRNISIISQELFRVLREAIFSIYKRPIIIIFTYTRGETYSVNYGFCIKPLPHKCHTAGCHCISHRNCTFFTIIA